MSEEIRKNPQVSEDQTISIPKDNTPKILEALSKQMKELIENYCQFYVVEGHNTDNLHNLIQTIRLDAKANKQMKDTFDNLIATLYCLIQIKNLVGKVTSLKSYDLAIKTNSPIIQCNQQWLVIGPSINVHQLDFLKDIAWYHMDTIAYKTSKNPKDTTFTESISE